MAKTTIKLIKEKVTKNTIRFIEKPEEGKPPVITQIYVQKWAVPNIGGESVVVTLDWD